MPSGLTPSAANRQPVHVGDDTILGTVYVANLILNGGPGSATAGTVTAGKRNIITGATTLTAAQSGSLCLWNTAAGYTFTLPAPVAGLYFEFLCTITNTSVACKVITNAGTVFLIGSTTCAVIATTPSSTAGPKAFAFDGSTHVASSFGGSDTTAGGVVGSRLALTCISATQWAISGSIIGAGTIVTSAATS